MTKKVWILYKPDADYSDATYIMGLGCEVEVIMPKWYEFTSVNGIRSQYLAENPHIEIVTTCEKQESMLYLKYGDELRLKHIIHRKLEPSCENFNLAPHRR